MSKYKYRLKQNLHNEWWRIEYKLKFFGRWEKLTSTDTKEEGLVVIQKHKKPWEYIS